MKLLVKRVGLVKWLVGLLAERLIKCESVDFDEIILVEYEVGFVVDEIWLVDSMIEFVHYVVLLMVGGVRLAFFGGFLW